MNREILLLSEKIKEVHEGDPWFGRNVRSIFDEIDESIVFTRPSGEHSILELLWHMITWKEFVISRFRLDKDLRYFEEQDWRALDHQDRSLWKKGLKRFWETHNELVEILQQQTDEILDQPVKERNYNFRNILSGIAEHDIYHLGQIAYLKKMLEGKLRATSY